MILIFILDCYVLIDPSATLSVVSSYVPSRLDRTPKCLPKSFSVSTAIGDIILAERVYRDCFVIIYH